MTSLLEPPAAQNNHTNPAQTLRTEMAAMRLSFTWFGVRKALSSEQKLIVSPVGVTRCLYGEAIPLSALGQVSISRGSYVEPTAEGQWTADLVPVDGPVLGPFPERSEALAAEVQWLTEHWLNRESAAQRETFPLPPS